MRIRSSHIVVAIVAVMGAFFLLIWLRTSNAKVGRGEDFIEEARGLRAAGAGSRVTEGTLPPSDHTLQDAPQIEVATDLYDMGEISNTGPTIGEVIVYNRGKLPLDIGEIRTSCGCTVGEMEKNSVKPDGTTTTVIPPGGQAPMKVTVDPYRIPGFYSRKTLTINSNDPKKPAVNVDVEARVRPEYILLPDTLDFGAVQKGEPTTETVIIRQANSSDLQVTGVEPGNSARAKQRARLGAGNTPSEYYTLSLQKRPESDWVSAEHPEWEVTVELSPDLPAGKFRDTFHILTNVKRADRLPYRMSADVQTFYTVSPSMLGVRNAVDPGQQKVATAMVRAETPLEVRDVSVTGDALTVSIRPGDGPNTCFVDLGVKPDAAPGLKNETLSFTVKSGEKALQHTMRVFASVKG